MVEPQMIEDHDFAYGGYAKIPADGLVEGDGVRLGADGPCWLVELVCVDLNSDEVSLVLTNRRVHIAKVVSASFAGGKHVDGMDEDPDPHFRVLPRTTSVWLRM